jgi:Endonuclease IV
MKKLGAHVSMTGSIWNTPINAHSIAAKASAMFTKNQKQSYTKPLEKEDIKQFKDTMEKLGYVPEDVLAHDSYLINLGHPVKESREQSYNSFLRK